MKKSIDLNRDLNQGDLNQPTLLNEPLLQAVRTNKQCNASEI